MRNYLCTMLVGVLYWAAPIVTKAEGPVETLPGGVTIQDNDTGNGESWGRVGGRNLTFSDVDLARFVFAEWGPISDDSVGIAFDGSIDSQEEILDYDAASSNLAAGIAVWMGTTKVELFNTGSGVFTPVQTRFILTVSDPVSGNPIPLQIGEARPGVDVLNAGGIFRANLQMQARLINSSDPFSPALDLFDSLETHPTATLLALTSLTSGFYYEATQGMSLEEHDSDIKGLLNELNGILGYLEIEVPNRLAGLSTEHGALDGRLTEILNQLSGLDYLVDDNELQQLEDNLTELISNQGNSDEVRQAVENILNILLVVIGIEPPPSELPPGFKLLQDLASQDSVDNVSAAIGDLASQINGLAEMVNEQRTDLDLISDLVSTRASQSSVDSFESSLQSVADQIQSQQIDLDLISSRADQSSVDGIAATLQSLDNKVNAQQNDLDLIQTRASQTSIDQLAAQVSTIQTNLDALSVRSLPSKLELSVLSVSGGQSAQQGRLLVLVTEQGVEAGDVVFNSVIAVTTSPNKPTESSDLDFTVTMLREGLFELAVDLPSGPSNATNFLVFAEHVHSGGINDGETHFGSALVADSTH